MAGSEKKFNQYTNPGALQDTDIFPFARSPYNSGTSFKTSMADVNAYILNKSVDVTNGQVAVGLPDGTLAGYSQFTYSAGDQKLIVPNMRVSLFLTAGVVHNDNLGNFSSSLMVNADIDAAAAIARSKLAALTVSRAMVTDGSGIDSVSVTTATEIGYVNGVTSAIQTQLDSKQNSDVLGSGYTTFVATGTTINLTNPLHNRIVTTGAGTGIIKFPKMNDADSMTSGKNTFVLFTNNCGGPVFIQDYDGNAVITISPGQSYWFFITSNGSNAGSFNTLNATSIINAASPLSYSLGFLSISQATTSTDGYLSSTDWNTFNSKQASGNYITALTGDVTAAGPGSVAATIATGAVTSSKIATGTIVNSNISASAAIDPTKLGAFTNGARVLVTNSVSKLIQESTLTSSALETVAVTAGSIAYGNGSSGLTSSSTFVFNGINLGIGTATPDASALLDLVSTTKGFGLMSMTTTQMNAISSPRAGLQIFNSTTSQFMGYNSSAWVILG